MEPRQRGSNEPLTLGRAREHRSSTRSVTLRGRLPAPGMFGVAEADCFAYATACRAFHFQVQRRFTTVAANSHCIRVFSRPK